MVLCKIIRPVMYSLFAIGILVAHFVQFSSQWYFISQDLGRFGFINERTIPTPVFLSYLKGFTFSGCGWSMVMRVFLIGTIICSLRDIPTLSASDAEVTTFLSVWQTVRMGLFRFGSGLLPGWN